MFCCLDNNQNRSKHVVISGLSILFMAAQRTETKYEQRSARLQLPSLIKYVPLRLRCRGFSNILGVGWLLPSPAFSRYHTYSYSRRSSSGIFPARSRAGTGLARRGESFCVSFKSTNLHVETRADGNSSQIWRTEPQSPHADWN